MTQKIFNLMSDNLKSVSEIKSTTIKQMGENGFFCAWFDLETEQYKWSRSGVSDEQIIWALELIKREVLD